MAAVIINNLAKAYKSIKALRGISLDVHEGELFGIIGPDGAGKSTLFRILTTLMKPDSGSVDILGIDAIKHFSKIRNIIGYMPQRFSLYMDLTVEENLKFFASIFNTEINENMQMIKSIYSQIEPFKHRKAGNLSGGMKQKLALSCALIHKPSLLLLDEPTTGVDAVSRKEFWEILQQLKSLGITIIVATPYMDEAMLCDRVALIQNGNILDIDTPSGIINKFDKMILSIKHNQKFNTMELMKHYEYCDSVYPFGSSIHYIDKRDNYPISDICGYLELNGIANAIVEFTLPTIEDVFMKLMGEDNYAG